MTCFILGASALFSCSTVTRAKAPENLENNQVQVQNLTSEIDPLDREPGKTADLETRVLRLENKISFLETRVLDQKTVSKPVENPEQLYEQAMTLLEEKKVPQASLLFDSFVQAYPDHSLADNAMYWQGECHYASGQYQQAIIVFKELVQKYPTAGKVPDALLKTGYAYLSLDDISQAHHFLKQVIKTYPFSPAAEKAQKKLKKSE